MKNSRLKLFPSILMLVAGSVTSIVTYYFHYEIKAALLVLLSVLLVFYIIGLSAVKVIDNFDQKNALEIALKEAKEKEHQQDEMNLSKEEEVLENTDT